MSVRRVPTRPAARVGGLLLLVGCGTGFAPAPEDPAAAGFDPVALAAAADALVAAGSRVVLVRRAGHLALSRYRPDHAPGRVHSGASVAKGIAGLGLALLAAEGRLSPEDPASRTVPAWRSDPRRSRITLAQLASHTSGLPNRAEAAWSERFWARRVDPFSVALRVVPLVAEPGTALHYSSPGFAVLELAMARTLRGTGTPDLLLHLRQRVLRRCGIPDEELYFHYFGPAGRRRDGLRLHGMWGGLSVSGRALARLGEILASPAQARACAGEAALALAAAMEPASPHALGDAGGPGLLPGFGFWLNRLGAWPELPCDAAMAYGAGDQLLVVVPSLELVVVRLGAPLPHGAGRGPVAAGAHVVVPLATALVAPAPGCGAGGTPARAEVGRPTAGLTPGREQP